MHLVSPVASIKYIILLHIPQMRALDFSSPVIAREMSVRAIRNEAVYYN